ncbi:CLUMA_CG003648, isoform A [Clunio marinus]|uniref:CLUMA_CG003648, isoform A n=1 Tax=Clunio marinus TaxID=568069 RepID=A0A1J1HPE3_9DIPT|nr:CLUMA_CG003648, isoform A [Clunio marinus]
MKNFGEIWLHIRYKNEKLSNIPVSCDNIQPLNTGFNDYYSVCLTSETVFNTLAFRVSTFHSTFTTKDED